MSLSWKSPPQGRETRFRKQEILFLAKACIRGRSDPLVGMSRSDEAVYQKVCDIYNQIIVGWNKEMDNIKWLSLFIFEQNIPYGVSFPIVYSQVSKNCRIERWRNSFWQTSFDSWSVYEKHQWRGAKRIQKIFGCIFLNEWWANKFDTQVCNPSGKIMPEDISVSEGVNSFTLKRNYTISNDNGKQQRIGHNKSNKISKRQKRRESASALTTIFMGGGHLEIIKQNL